MISTPGAQSHGQFDWHQSAGHWHRQIDEAERFYANFCRKADDADSATFPITGHVSFTVDVPDNMSARETSNHIKEAIRRGWLALRDECPTIASWIEFDSKTNRWEKFLVARDKYDPSDWLSHTLRVERGDLDEHWFNSNPPVYKLPTLFLIEPPSDDATQLRRELYLRCPHDTVDGIGELWLLNRVLEYASGRSIAPPETEGHLAAPLREAVDIPERPTESQKSLFKDLIVKAAQARSEVPLLGLPMTGDGDKGSMQRLASKIPAQKTVRLLQICKERGVTITNVASAAIVLAMRDLQSFPPEQTTTRYCGQGLINLRNLCNPSHDPFAVGNYHMIALESHAIDIPTKNQDGDKKTNVDELFSVAKQFRDYYDRVRPDTATSKQDLLSLVPLTWDLMTPKSSTPAAPESKSAAVAISSLGNISNIIGARHGMFSVTNAWVVGEPLSNEAVNFLQTFDGALELSTVYSPGFHDTAHIETFQRAAVEHLEGILGEQGLGA